MLFVICHSLLFLKEMMKMMKIMMMVKKMMVKNMMVKMMKIMRDNMYFKQYL